MWEQAHVGGWCALELLDLRLRKHGSDCLATFVLEIVRLETAGCKKSAKCSWGPEHKSEHMGCAAHLRLVSDDFGRASANALPPSGPRLLLITLPTAAGGVGKVKVFSGR